MVVSDWKMTVVIALPLMATLFIIKKVVKPIIDIPQLNALFHRQFLLRHLRKTHIRILSGYLILQIVADPVHHQESGKTDHE